MENSFMLMLLNLMHIHNYLYPSSSHLFSESSDAASPSAVLYSTSALPLLFFTLATVLAYTASHSPKKITSAISPRTPSDFSVAAFRSLSTERIRAMEAPLRDAQWRSLYGLSYPLFTTVVDKLKPYMTRSQLSLPSDYAVAMVLSRLSHGLSLKTLAYRYGLEPYVISKITNMVTRLLATKLYPQFIKIPVSSRRLAETTHGFQELTSLPNICGAIDSTPIKLHKLSPEVINGSMYICSQGFPSISLQVVSDHKKIFWDVCVKAPGGCDNATHFRDSFIVGNLSFPLLSFLLTPFNYSRNGNPVEDSFDEAMMKGRKVGEEAIGLLKGRWKILQDMNVELNHVPQTIVACCVLHNLCQIAREPEPDVCEEAEKNRECPRMLEDEKSFFYYGESLREALADDLYQRLSCR